jgi:hypothetical protein
MVMNRSARLFVALPLALAACSSAVQVHRFGATPIDASARAFVLLETSRWETQLRVAFDQHGFTLRKFASTGTVRQNRITDSAGVRIENERSFTQAGARYGLTLTQLSQQDFCPWNGNVNATFSLEVTDLRTNEVVLVIERGNWTGLCGPFSVRSKYAFEELTDQLAKSWKQ